MTLAQLTARKRLVVLGLNSGTSADGLDMAALRFSRSPRGLNISFLRGASKRYPQAIRHAVLAMADSTQTTLESVVRLDSLLGQFFAREAARFIGKLGDENIRIDLIASHGQTVRHVPKKERLAASWVHGTLQLGSPELIAAHTHCAVVSDFRQGEVAQGGEGAPITGGAMARLCGDHKESRLIVNIGGMANYFYLPASGRGHIQSADCGPGNSLSDILCQRLVGKPFDRGGRLAASGTISHRLVSLIGGESFFSSKLHSTGRESFGQRLAESVLGAGSKLALKPGDIVASAMEITARSIVQSLQTILAKDRTIQKLYLTGGGVHNKFLLLRLKELCRPREVMSVAALGLDPDLVEAASFAVLGEAALRSESLPTAPSSRAAVILGRIVQPPRRV